MNNDFDDIFDAAPAPGDPVVPKPKRAAPEPKVETDDAKMYDYYQSREGQRKLRMASTGRGHQVDEKEFYMPVGVSFLAKVLRLNAETIQRRLRTVTPVGHAGTSQNRPLYDFASVVPFLVKPKMDIRTYLRSLNPTDMPPNISKVFWEAERIRTKTLVEAGEAWPTEQVLTVMSQANKMVNDRIPLLVEAMREEGLDDDLLKKLEAACDQFRTDVHEAFVEFPKSQSTPPHLANVAVGLDDD